MEMAMSINVSDVHDVRRHAGDRREEALLWRNTVRGIVTLTLGLLLPSLAATQPPAHVPQIGVLTLYSSSSPVPLIEAFREGLRALGYVEGQNIVIEYRWGEGNVERLPALATELVHLKVDLIVVVGTQAIQAAKHATTTIPIVMAASSDPVGTGLVTSLSRPGGNITGLSVLAPELSGKRLELLKDAIPGLARVAVLWQGGHPAATLALHEVEAAGRLLRLQLQSLEVRGPNDFERAFAAASGEGAEALIVLSSAFFGAVRRQLVERVTTSRLPAMYPSREYAEAGGLMSYGPSLPDLFRRAATYVDKILKGAKPGDLPVEQPMKFELVINLKTARALGLTMPPLLLFRADEVLE
jgi:putative ABC transport system substrate-binding protein